MSQVIIVQVFKRNRRHDDPPAPNRKPSRKSTILSIGGELTSESESPAKEELSVVCIRRQNLAPYRSTQRLFSARFVYRLVGTGSLQATIANVG